MSKNLPPSRAGIGSRLKTQRLIDIIAHSIKINTIPLEIDFVIKSTIPIGQDICLIASCLSLGVSGVKIFPAKSESHLKVRIICP